MPISWRKDHTPRRFLERTVAAQLHLAGAFLAVFGCLRLLKLAGPLGDERQVWACLAYGATGFLVFASSALFHFMADGLALEPWLEDALERVDLTAIYLFIAGCYTPLALNAGTPGRRLRLVAAAWACALAGTAYTLAHPVLPGWAKHRFLYTGLYVVTALVVVFQDGGLWSRLPGGGAALLFSGIAVYAAGAVIFALNRARAARAVFGPHELWHLLVLCGAALHYRLILKLYP